MDTGARIKEVNGKQLIFDPVRKKFVALTPEEHVRQQWLHFLIHEKQYPVSRIAVEAALRINGLSKRADILIYDNNAKPHLMVECKAPHVAISQKTFDQIARYNMKFRVKYLLITNGANYFISEMDYDNNTYA